MSSKKRLASCALIAALCGLSQCTGNRDLFQVDVVPATQAVNAVADTAHYTAIGHFTHSPVTEDITQKVFWKSSNEGVATIDSSGVATARGFGAATIIASSTAGWNHALITGQAIITVGNGNLPFLVVQAAGMGTGVVTSLPTGIDCGQTCSAPFAIGSTVVLTATPDQGSTFGTWTNCDSTSGNTCTVILNSTRSVTATFN
jgi:hypothetical protein